MSTRVPSTAQLPVGFQASGTTCGIKVSGKSDLALFVSDRDATAVRSFYDKQSLRRAGDCFEAASSINNRSSRNHQFRKLKRRTGEPGIRDAKIMTAAVAEQIGCRC
jgi:glutamate N-acetyltransferase/amino-acid N-acetyltransferase